MGKFIDFLDIFCGGEIATKIIHRAFELGVIMISLRGNILRFQPPLVITTAQLDRAFTILDQVFSEEAAQA